MQIDLGTKMREQNQYMVVIPRKKRNVRYEEKELRFNPNHDSKTGRFTTGSSGSVQQMHAQAIKKLNGPEYESGTYDVATLEPVEYNKGYQVTFSQIGDNYSSREYAERVDEFVKASSDGKTSLGKFEGTPEVSFHVDDRKTAEELGRKYNQISIWDWANNDEISTGGTGKRK